MNSIKMFELAESCHKNTQSAIEFSWNKAPRAIMPAAKSSFGISKILLRKNQNTSKYKMQRYFKLEEETGTSFLVDRGSNSRISLDRPNSQDRQIDVLSTSIFAIAHNPADYFFMISVTPAHAVRTCQVAWNRNWEHTVFTISANLTEQYNASCLTVIIQNLYKNSPVIFMLNRFFRFRAEILHSESVTSATILSALLRHKSKRKSVQGAAALSSLKKKWAPLSALWRLEFLDVSSRAHSSWFEFRRSADLLWWIISKILIENIDR
jgi:hypothetical protein